MAGKTIGLASAWGVCLISLMHHSLPSNYNVPHFLEGAQSHILFQLFKLEKFLMKDRDE